MTVIRRIHLAVTVLLSVGLVAVLMLGWAGPRHGTAHPDLATVITEIEREGLTPQLDARLKTTATAMGAPGLFVVDTASPTGHSQDVGPIVSAYPESVVGESDVVSAMGKIRTESLVNRLSNLEGGTIARMEPAPGQRYSLVLVSRWSPIVRGLQVLLLACLTISGLLHLRRFMRQPA